MAEDKIRPARLTDERKKCTGTGVIYIRTVYWAESGGDMRGPGTDTTVHLPCLCTAPIMPSQSFILLVSRSRRTTFATMSTNAESGCRYRNDARAVMEAKRHAFDNELILDMFGNAAETGISNTFMMPDDLEFTPQPNGCFLNGITRQRTIALLRDACLQVRETALTVADFNAADEIFSDIDQDHT